MIYVAGGTVHTLGPGSVIVETQQQSDTTYRLYDYGRPRELHLKDGLAAVKVESAVRKSRAGRRRANSRQQEPAGAAGGRSLLCCRHVRVERTPRLSARATIRGNLQRRSWWHSKAAEWSKRPDTSRLLWRKAMLWLFRHVGEHFNVSPQWTLEFLRSRVPGSSGPSRKHECSELQLKR